PFNLQIGSQTIESVTTALGGHMTYAIGMSWGVLMPLLSANWQHEYKNNARTTTGSVVAQPSTSVIVQTNNPDRNYAHLVVGVSATFSGGNSAFVHYEEVLGLSNFTNRSFNAGFRMEFYPRKGRFTCRRLSTLPRYLNRSCSSPTDPGSRTSSFLY